MILHVYPVDDIKSHVMKSNCDCHPTLEEQPSGDFICIHNAWDQREITEVYVK